MDPLITRKMATSASIKIVESLLFAQDSSHGTTNLIAASGREKVAPGKNLDMWFGSILGSSRGQNLCNIQTGYLMIKSILANATCILSLECRPVASGCLPLELFGMLGCRRLAAYPT